MTRCNPSNGFPGNPPPGPDARPYLPKVPDLYAYTDYRAWLRDHFEARRAVDSFVSMRFIAAKVGTDAGTIVKILQDQLHLSPRLIPGMVALCKLSERQADYFQALVDFAKARTDADIRRTFERMQALRGIETRTLEADQYAFYQSWIHSAVRAVVGITPFEGDFQTLAAALHPRVTPDQARQSIELLERIGLLRRDAHQRLVLADNLVTTGEKWRGPAVRAFQKQTMELAADSLERDPVELREHSTVTLTLRRSDLCLLKERAASFRQDLLKIAQAAEGEDAVFQVNVQIFPMALLGGEAP